MDVFDLYAKISLDSKGYEKGLNTAKTNFDGFKTHVGDALEAVAKITAAATAAVAGASIAIGKSVVTNAKEIAAYGDNIDKMSQKMGMSAETYQEWDAVMQHSGTSIESMKASMKILANAAQTNNKAFEQLGITEKELKSLNQEELFAKTIEKLQKVDDTTQRTYLAGKLLGRGATELGALLNTSAEDTQKMKERVHQLGGVMSNEGVKAAAKFQDNLQDMKTALSGLKRGIFNDTLPAFNDLMDGFTKLIAGEKGAEDKIDSGMKKLVTSVDKIVPKIQNLTETLLPKAITIGSKLVTEIAKSLPKIIAEVAPTLFNAGVEIITSVTNGIYDMLDKSNFDEKAKTMTEKVNNMIGKIDTDSSAEKFSDILNKVINAGFNIASTFDYKQAAEKLTDWSNSALKNLDIGKLGATVSSAWKGVWDFIGTALGNIDWENIGNKISEFINNIDWNGILHSMFKAIGELIKGAPELLKGVVESLDFENAAGLFAMLAAPKMAKKLLNFIKTDSDTISTLKGAGTAVGGHIGIGADGTTAAGATSFIGKLSSGFKTAGVLATAFSIGWEIGSIIYTAFEPWISDAIDAIQDVMSAAEDAEAAVKNAESISKLRGAKALDKWHDLGYKYLTIDDINNWTPAFQKAAAMEELYRKFPQLERAQISRDTLMNRTDWYEDLQKGIVPSYIQKKADENAAYSAAYSAVSRGMLGVPTSELNKQAKIYLDTGKLVGGTGNARAQQTNYTKRGYAT